MSANTNSEWTNEPAPFADDPDAAARERVVDALLAHRAGETRATVDARVARAVSGLGRVEPHAAPARGTRGRSVRLGALGAGVAAAVLFGALLMFDRPSTASAVLAQAHAAERAAGDRRYEVTVELPPPPGAAHPMMSIFMVGTLDVRDDRHMRLTMVLPDGRTMVRALDGDTSWTQRPDGAVLRLPSDAPWPRYVETPSGELLVDRLSTFIEDVEGHYDVTRCGGMVPIEAAGLERLCAAKRDPEFRGAERVELWVDPATHAVVRARLEFGDRLPERDRAGRGPGPGPRGGAEGDGPRGPGPGPRGGADGDGPRGPGSGPRGGAEGDGPRGPGPRGGPEHVPPRSIVISRVALPAGGFAASHFAPASEPQEPPVGSAEPDRPEPPPADQPPMRGRPGGRPATRPGS
jgi:hypothetical protein